MSINMGTSTDLKVVNEVSARRLHDILVDCKTVDFYQSSDGVINVIGTEDKRLSIAPVLNPEETQIVSFTNCVSGVKFAPQGIYVLLDSGKIEFITKLKKWESSLSLQLILQDEKVLNFSPVAEGPGIAVCTGRERSLIIYYTLIGKPLWSCVGKFDCLSNPSCHLCISPTSQSHRSTVLVGNGDGHLYRLPLKGGRPTLLCDIQQPIVSVHSHLNQLLIIGKFGKVVLLETETSKVSADFAPSFVSQSSLIGNQLYIQHGLQFYSSAIQKGEKLLGEKKYFPVKSVRAFNAGSQSVTALTENGTVYQINQPSGQVETFNVRTNGDRVPSILREIHRCADKTKEANQTGQQVHHELTQLSTALQMLGTNQPFKFPIELRSYSLDPLNLRSETVNVSVKNSTRWNFQASDWAIRVSVGRFGSNFHVDWKSGQTAELIQTFHLQEARQVPVKVNLVFRSTVDNVQPPVCVFPVAEFQLGLLHFLQPLIATQFEELAATKLSNGAVKVSTAFGIRQISGSGVLWPRLLTHSWHRGFSQLHPNLKDSTEIFARYAETPVRFCVKEERNDFGAQVSVIVIDTFDKLLMQQLRMQMITQLMQTSTGGDIRVPSHVHSHLQNLRNRMNYVLKLTEWDESDLQPLMDETDMLLAKHLPVIITASNA